MKIFRVKNILVIQGSTLVTEEGSRFVLRCDRVFEGRLIDGVWRVRFNNRDWKVASGNIIETEMPISRV